MHRRVVRAIETYRTQRETAEIKADTGTLRAPAEARESDVVYGTEVVRDLVAGRHTS